MTVYENVCSCVPFTVSNSQFVMLSLRLRFILAIHVGDSDSCLQFVLVSHVGDSHLGFRINFFLLLLLILSLWANSADNKLMFFLIFPENRH